MWLTISTAIAAVTLLLLLHALRHFRSDVLTKFLLIAIWGRYVLAAFHEWTFPSMVGGMSLNAIASIVVGIVGFISIPLIYIRMRELVALYVLLFVITLSSVINGEIGGVIGTYIKWIYFLAILLLVCRAIGIHGREAILRGVFVCLSTPLLLQAASVVTGHSKEGPDGSLSFIGGYFHEAVFSVVLLTAMWLATMIRWQRPAVGPLLVLVTAIGIVLTNYRTTMLAALPIILVYFFARGDRQDRIESRRLFTLPLMLVSAFLVFELGDSIQQRFSDLWVVINAPGELMKPPALYTDEEQDLFSARLYLWAHYFEAFAQGDAVQRLVGYGPEAYVGTLPKHAHNTFISYLYEFGLLGLLALIVWYVQNLLRMLRARDPLVVWSGTAGQIAFLMVNLATIPLWQIEGLIFYALLVASSLQTGRANVSPMQGS